MPTGASYSLWASHSSRFTDEHCPVKRFCVWWFNGGRCFIRPILIIGYAADGYGIYAMKDAQGNEAIELDECRGQTDDVRGYHYHAASPSENMFIGCLSGESIQTAGGGGGPPPEE